MKTRNQRGDWLLIVVVLAAVTVFTMDKCNAKEPDRMEDMRSTYVELAVIDGQGTIQGKATGIAISPTRVVTTFHSLKAGTNIYTPVLTDPFTGQKQGTSGRVLHTNTFQDIVVLEFGMNLWKPRRIRFAKEITVGETLSMYSNTLGEDMMFHQVIVSKIKSDRILITPPVGPGASGSALFNDKGELVGMVRGARWFNTSKCNPSDSGTPWFGFIVPVDQLKPVIQEWRRIKSSTAFDIESNEPGGR